MRKQEKRKEIKQKKWLFGYGLGKTILMIITSITARIAA